MNNARVLRNTALLLCSVFATSFNPGLADPLPQAGTIAIHTGWKVSANVIEAGAKRLIGNASVSGTSFNDAGRGALHGGPANCVATFYVADGVPRNKGFCAFGDADGDRFFTEWTGGPAKDGIGTEGVNTILGGTGKYAGIQGTGTWKSKDLGPNGEHLTTQRFEYRMP